VIRRDSVARRSKFDNWRLAAEQGFTLTIARAEFQDQVSEHEQAFEFHLNKPPNYREEVEKELQEDKLAALLKGSAR
jgi:hypothetical protein